MIIIVVNIISMMNALVKMMNQDEPHWKLFATISGIYLKSRRIAEEYMKGQEPDGMKLWMWVCILIALSLMTYGVEPIGDVLKNFFEEGLNKGILIFLLVLLLIRLILKAFFEKE